MSRFRKEVIQAENQRLESQREQRNFLDQQIDEKRNTRKMRPVTPTFENKHARDESSLFASQIERAKKLYEEQLDMLSKKRRYEAQMAKIQSKAHSERLETYKSR